MKKHEKETVSILDSLLDWMVEVGRFAPDLPGLERAKGLAARARELVVMESEDERPEIVVIRRQKKDTR